MQRDILKYAWQGNSMMEDRHPQEPEEQHESTEQRQKRYELLYAYAKSAYDNENKRLDEAETMGSA